MEVKLSTENIRAIALFEKVTNVSPKDCIIMNNSIYFLVKSDSVGMAIGKNGDNIKHLRRISGKNIKIFPYSDNIGEFLKNVIPGLKTIDNDGESVIVSVNKQDKITVIGKNGDNINAIRELLKRHFGVQNFKLR